MEHPSQSEINELSSHLSDEERKDINDVPTGLSDKEKEELKTDKASLDRLYYNFCHKLRNVFMKTNERHHAADFVIPVSHLYVYDRLEAGTRRLINLPAKSIVFKTPANYIDPLESHESEQVEKLPPQEYIVDPVRRRIFIYGNRPLPEFKGRYTEEHRSLTDVDINNYLEKFCKFLFDHSNSIIFDIFSATEESYQNILVPLPGVIMEYIIELLEELEPEKTMKVRNVLKLVSKAMYSIVSDISPIKVIHLRASYERKLDRYIFNYLENMSLTYAWSLVLVNSKEYAFFERVNDALFQALENGEKENLMQYRKRNSLNTYGSIEVSPMEDYKYNVQVTSNYSRAVNQKTHDMMAYVVNQLERMSITEIEKEEFSVDFAQQEGIMWGLKLDTDLMPTVFDLLMNITSSIKGYEFVISFKQLDRSYMAYEKKFESIKNIQLRGFENSPIKDMRMAPIVNGNNISWSVRNKPLNSARKVENYTLNVYMPMHMFIKPSKLRQSIDEDVTRAFVDEVPVSGYFIFNAVQPEFSTSDPPEFDRLREKFFFILFKQDPNISNGKTQIDWDQYTPPSEPIYLTDEMLNEMDVKDITGYIQKSMKVKRRKIENIVDMDTPPTSPL